MVLPKNPDNILNIYVLTYYDNSFYHTYKGRRVDKYFANKRFLSQNTSSSIIFSKYFRTILYMMFVYAAGNLLVAVTAIPFLELPGRYEVGLLCNWNIDHDPFR